MNARSPRVDALIAAGLAVLAASAVALTAADYGPASDESLYVESARRIVTWVERLAAEGTAAALTPAAMDEGWHWMPMRVVHPPLSRIASALTWVATRQWLDGIVAFRLASAVFSGLLAVLVFTLAAELAGRAAPETGAEHWPGRGRFAGIMAVALLFLTPHVFAHLHVASPDPLLTLLWVAAPAAMLRWGSRASGAALTGAVCGLAVATKFNAVAIAPVLAVWCVVWQRGRLAPLALRLALLGGTAALTAIVANPMLWPDVGARFADLMATSLSREEHWTVMTSFFGESYVNLPPPAYIPVMFLLTTPLTVLVAHLAGIVLGLVDLVRRPRRADLQALALAFALLLPVVHSLPSVVAHDGVRLILPSFPWLAILAGAAVARATAALRAGVAGEGRRRLAVAGVAGAIVTAPFLHMVAIHPYQLSSFNALIGGPVGAERAGLEVATSKTEFNVDQGKVLDRLAPPDARVYCGFLSEEIEYAQRAGWVRADLSCVPRPPLDYVVVYNRPAHFNRFLEVVMASTRPEYELAIDGVWLIRYYRIAVANPVTTDDEDEGAPEAPGAIRAPR